MRLDLKYISIENSKEFEWKTAQKITEWIDGEDLESSRVWVQRIEKSFVFKVWELFKTRLIIVWEMTELSNGTGIAI